MLQDKLKKIRHIKQLSQRELAKRSGISLRTLQMAEMHPHHSKLETLNKIFMGLGHSKDFIEKIIESYALIPRLSLAAEALEMLSEWEKDPQSKNWMIHYFNFVDEFNRTHSFELLEFSPNLPSNCPLMPLLASTAEHLASINNLLIPSWTKGVPALSSPWFLAGRSSLMAFALLESPLAFKMRNIFVLENFLHRV